LFQQIADDVDEIGGGKSGAKEFKPEALAIKAQGEFLRGEGAIGLIKLLYLSQGAGRVHGIRVWPAKAWVR